jgi:DNA-binding CsgD family transcriptional regulator
MSLDIEKTSLELIDLVYACLLGEADWQLFLDRLSGMLPGGKSVFLFHDSARNQGAFSLASGLGEKEFADYNMHYSHRNPWMKKAAVRPVGLGVVSEQMLERSALLRTEYYSDFLRRIDCEAAVGVTVARDGSRAFNLSTITHQADTEKNVPAARVLTNVAPHLQRAFRHYRAAAPTAASQQMTMLAAAGIGLVTVGPNATMTSANPVAMELIHRGEICSTSPLGALSVRNAEADTVMRQMLSAGSPRHFTYHESTGNGRAKVTLVRLNRDPVAEFFAGPTVAVLIDIVHMDVGDVAANFSSRYRLTPAEARLAQALDRGTSLKEAAVAFGISEGTARQQLKSIFRKVGVNRQSELIRAMHDPAFRVGGSQ